MFFAKPPFSLREPAKPDLLPITVEDLEARRERRFLDADVDSLSDSD
jgi:hypothetical protein